MHSLTQWHPSWAALVVTAGVLGGAALLLVTLAIRAHRNSLITPASRAFLGRAALWTLPAAGLWAWLGFLAAPQLRDAPPPLLSYTTARLLEETPAADAASDDVADPNAIPVAGNGAEITPTIAVRASQNPWGPRRLLADNSALVTLSSEAFATVEEAEAQLYPAVIELAQDYFHQFHPYAGPWTIPSDYLHHLIIVDRHDHAYEHDFGSVQGTMHRLHLRCSLSPLVRDRLEPVWRGQVVRRRLIVWGELITMASLMLTAVAGYFRLNNLTQGQQRRRLQLAAGALVAAGGCLCGWGLQHPPVLASDVPLHASEPAAHDAHEPASPSTVDPIQPTAVPPLGEVQPKSNNPGVVERVLQRLQDRRAERHERRRARRDAPATTPGVSLRIELPCCDWARTRDSSPSR